MNGGGRVRFPADGKEVEGYLATSPGGGPAVIVLQEWWGLVPHIEDLARRFAAEGFVALAPDLYQGRTTTSPDEAGKLMMALDIGKAARILAGAIRHLLDHPATRSRRVGVVGFCMGGQLALYAAARFPAEVGACIDFYGIHPAVKPDLDALAAPVLGFFAERDASVTPAAARSLERELRARGKTVTFEVVAGVDHGFFNDTRAAVHAPAAARDCWEKSLSFFRAHLGPAT